MKVWPWPFYEYPFDVIPNWLNVCVCISDFLHCSVAALMSVKSWIRDERRVMQGWDINSVDPCTWNMVACSVEGFVISL